MVALAVFAASGASAAPEPRPAGERDDERFVDLPVAGLRVRLRDELARAPIEVASSWSEAMAWDRLTLGASTYEVQVGARTARDCPMPEPFDVTIGDASWIRSRDRYCLLLPESRLIVRVVVRDVGGGVDGDGGGGGGEVAHPALFEALREALVKRRLTPPGVRPPPLYEPLPESMPLRTVGLELRRPDERARWRVAEPRSERDFDALVREVPAFPEVQLSVRRHPRATIADCARLFRALLAGPWRADDLDPAETPGLAGWQGVLGRRLGRYRSYMICRESGDALIDVRVAIDPERDAQSWVEAVAPMLGALAAARPLGPPPPTRVLEAPVDATLLRSASLLIGASLPGTLTRAERAPRADPAPYIALEVGARWSRRNHLAFGGSLAVGVDGHGLTLLGRLDLGVAVGVDDDTTFVVAFGVEDREEAIVANRTLSTIFELRHREHVPGAFSWALRMQPLHIASREPAIRGVPLTLGWQGMWPSGILVGVDVAWVDVPPHPSAGWPTEGLALGLRFGWGDRVR